ncbi:MAG: hypothetical protein KDI05_12755 [Halieaceae bacterium]|nr:hypothetical protein [Halieaceae bacterium]MCP5204133.1 hypothetical protein [Pseudomonadales bacterium]
MNTVLKVLVVLAGLFFVVMGLRWAVDPAGAAATLGMPLLEGAARSSQMADIGVFFLAGGLFIFTAVITARRSWYHVPALIMFGAAIYRLIAWLFHDAAFVVDGIAVEVIVGSLLLFAGARLARD